MTASNALIAVTPLLADDNWGNLLAVMPDGKHPGGGGIYYHVDCWYNFSVYRPVACAHNRRRAAKELQMDQHRLTLQEYARVQIDRQHPLMHSVGTSQHRQAHGHHADLDPQRRRPQVPRDADGMVPLARI